MPFKSKSQQRWMFAAESRGEVPKGTAQEWAHATKSIKALPEHIKKQKKTASLSWIEELAKEAAHRATSAERQ